MHFKKPTAAVLAAILLFSLLLAGCQDTADGGAATDATSTAATSAGAAATTAGVPSDWKTTTTAYSFADDDPVNKAPAKEQLVYVQNADGTLTDKMNGTVFFDDVLQSLTVGESGCFAKTVSGLAILTDTAAFGDTTLAAATASDARVTYYLKGGITEAAVTVYAPGEAVVGEEFTLLTSADGKTFTAATYSSREPDRKEGALVCRTYHFFNLPKNACYLKLELTAETGGVSSVKLGRVRVNNVHKMYYTANRLENRAAATFYVDAQNGSDDNDGKSPETAYKSLAKISSRFFGPGDRILFKRGCTFVGNASLKGLGLAAHRLYVGAYGEGAAPIIAANGGTALSVAMDYVTVENLEVTNPSGVRGIDVVAGHTGANKGIIVQNCYVHDVNVAATYFGYDATAIRAKVEIRTAPTWFDGITIRNNTIKNTGRCAIFMNTAWADRYATGWGCSREFYKDDDNGWWPSERVTIAENSIHTTLGDAILVIGGRGVNIDRNEVFDAYAIDSETLAVHASAGANKACAAVWSINCNDVYIQRNEVGYTNFPATGADAEGIDIDIGQRNVTVQYNYSHNNGGGFLLLCDVESCHPISEGSTHTVRHNLSVDDEGQGVFMVVGTVAKVDIYNNTIIQRSASTYGLYIFGDSRNFCFRNNIFSGQRAALVCVLHGVETKNMLFDNNVFDGGAYIPNSVFYGSKLLPAADRGFTVTDSNRSVEVTFRNPDYTPTDAFTSDRAAAIAAYTPVKAVDGAYPTPATVDINGDEITEPFYGCVKH